MLFSKTSIYRVSEYTGLFHFTLLFKVLPRPLMKLLNENIT